MKNCFWCISILLILLSCKSQIYVRKPDFKYQAWQNNILTQFDNLISSNGEVAQKGLSNMEMVRKEISYVDSTKFREILDYSLAKNSVQNWNKAYYVYHYFEGEVNITLSTIIFFTKSGKVSGFTYSHNLNKYYSIRDKSAIRRATKIHSGIEACNNGIFIISKFDKDFINRENKIVVGMCNANLQSFLKIYDINAFD